MYEKKKYPETLHFPEPLLKFKISSTSVTIPWSCKIPWPFKNSLTFPWPRKIPPLSSGLITFADFSPTSKNSLTLPWPFKIPSLFPDLLDFLNSPTFPWPVGTLNCKCSFFFTGNMELFATRTRARGGGGIQEQWVNEEVEEKREGEMVIKWGWREILEWVTNERKEVEMRRKWWRKGRRGEGRGRGRERWGKT